jgi:hypothetical protein
MDPPADANDILRLMSAGGLRDTFDRNLYPIPSADPVKPQKPLITPTPWRWVAPESLPTREWLYGRYLMRGTLSLTVAPGGVGKSSLSMAEAIAMASGQNFLRESLPAGALRVWYVNCEDPDSPTNPELSRRAAGICKQYGIGEADLGGRLFLDSAVLRPMKLAGPDQTAKVFTLHEEEISRIEAEIRRHQIDVVILDPFVSTHDLDENNNPMIDRLAKRLIGVATSCNCAIGLVHHTRKTNGIALDAESARGASALVAAARVVRVLTRMEAKEGEKAGLSEGDHRRFFRTVLDKQNLAPPEAERNWYEMVSVPLGNGKSITGYDDDVVGVPCRWSWPEQKLNFDRATIRAVQDAIDGKDYPENCQANEWVGWEIAEIVGLAGWNKNAFRTGCSDWSPSGGDN